MKAKLAMLSRQMDNAPRLQGNHNGFVLLRYLLGKIVQRTGTDRYFCYASPRNSEANPSQRGQHMATPTVASKKLLLCEADAMVKKLCAKASARESEAQD